MREVLPGRPMDLERLFEKPGREWNATERGDCVEWLFSAELERMIVATTYFLGVPATVSHAEDAWARFCLGLGSVSDSYEPAKGRFPAYLLHCLKRFCGRERQRLARQLSVERPLLQPDGSANNTRPCLGVRGSEADLRTALQNKDLVVKLLAALPGRMADVVVAHDLRGESIRATARKLGVPEGTIKTWRHRALQKMRDHLRRLERR